MKAAGPSVQNAIRAMRAPSENTTMVKITIKPICCCAVVCCCAVGCLPNYCKNAYQFFSPAIPASDVLQTKNAHGMVFLGFFGFFSCCMLTHSLTHSLIGVPDWFPPPHERRKFLTQLVRRDGLSRARKGRILFGLCRRVRALAVALDRQCSKARCRRATIRR